MEDDAEEEVSAVEVRASSADSVAEAAPLLREDSEGTDGTLEEGVSSVVLSAITVFYARGE